MSYFSSWIPDLLHVLGTQPKDAAGNPTGPSAADSIQSMLPGVGAAAGNISGLQSMILQRQYRQQLADQQMRQKQLDLQTQNSQGEAALRNAQIGNLNSEVAARQNPPLKPKEESWEIVPGVTGPNNGLVQMEKNSGQTRLVSSMPGLKPALPKSPNAQPLSDAQTKQLNGTSTLRYQALYPGQTLPDELTLQSGANGEDYSRLSTALSSLEQRVAQQQQAKNQQQDFQTRRQDQIDARNDKRNAATADEKKRADLAKNANENLGQLEDIVNRRPDLFGKLSGRVTQAREWLGTNDKDIGALKNISDNLGMVQQSAHGMRSAQHVEQAANSILNSYKNGPDATKAAINAARSSVATFLADVGETPDSHPRAANQGGNTGGNSGTVSVTDPNGGIHTFANQADANKFKKLAGIQ